MIKGGDWGDEVLIINTHLGRRVVYRRLTIFKQSKNLQIQLDSKESTYKSARIL